MSTETIAMNESNIESLSDVLATMRAASPQCERFAARIEYAIAHGDIARIKELVGEYWNLAYTEGREGRDCDTPEGDAARTLHAINEELAVLGANARRYVWLRERLDSVDWFYGEPPRAVLTFHIPSNMRVSANLDTTIDGEMPKAAAQRQEQEGGSRG